MNLITKPDFDMCAKRMEAFWNRAVLDRPFIQVTAPKPESVPLPVSRHDSLRARWLDADFAVDRALAFTENIYWGADAIPMFFPNLGPEVMSTAYGAELDFSERTSWSHPVLQDWDRLESLSFNPNSFYISKILEIMRCGLERGRGRFITGITDIHPGGDLAASLRNPQDFCIDLLDSPELVERLLVKIQPDFQRFYDLQYQVMLQMGQTVTTTWATFFTEGRYYVPSNDFSCMVSPELFERFFLSRLAEECTFLDRSVYHLDGPNALPHLPAILSIADLDAVQWVYGEGHGPARRWIPVYQQIQAAGKGLQVCGCTLDDLDDLMANLRPEGVALTGGCHSIAEADAFIRKASQWS